MKRIVQSLNVDWLYIPRDLRRAAKLDCPQRGFSRVSIPHTNIELPYHNFSEQEHCFVSWYRKHVLIPAAARGRRTFIDFDGVMIAATVFVNGRQVGPEHKGGYTPFSRDITDFVQPGRRNLIAVRVDSTERTDIPPFGGVVDYLTFGGIYRDVRLRITSPARIENVFARPADVLAPRKRLDLTVRLANSLSQDRPVAVEARLLAPDGRLIAQSDSGVTIPAAGIADLEMRLESLRGIRLWDLNDPALYRLIVELDNGDSVETRVGFRTAEFRDDGAFYLNGKPLKLRGLNRHQTFPYVGQAGSARMQRDAQILRNELACNIVRTSHYPQSPHFLDACDELGLLVLEEIPGWNHIGDDAWRKLVLRDVEAMIVRDRNRPSIVLWGVRINESEDHHELYSQTNALVRRLDPTRQTGGIRCHWNSELLEDVYTMNDFAPETLHPPAAPRYLNTEFCGHMFSTKTFDQEERRWRSALYHADRHNQIGGMASAGGIGWCAFDYNTHLHFGSGDRVCYHGVMDIFRQPKLAAAFYASQEDPQRRLVLELGGYWKRGDRSQNLVDPQWVFTNVEEVEILVGGQSRGRFKPARDRYPHLPHPPVLAEKIGGNWRTNWQDLTLVGYIAGREVIRRSYAGDGIPQRLEAAVDDRVIDADGADMTRLSLRITDAYGNILPFAMQPVHLTIRGPGVLVGENPMSMPGGRGAVYIRSTRKPGVITVTATTERLKPQTVTVRAARWGEGSL